jgi:cytochrome o ubiquinol oxidase subunit 2
MKTHRKVISGATLLLLIIIAVTGWYLHRHTVAVLQPVGPIAHNERNLIIFCSIISAVIVIPVFGMLWYIAWHYREQNHKAKYSPDLEGSKIAETIWWVVPSLIIMVISIATWKSSYALDPFKVIQSSKPTLHVQVVALDWKWLFIYPGQNVASVNEAAIPVNTPVDFELTSDAVMSSFWDPQLGGQMYAMPGMDTQLNLEANQFGSFSGRSANINGSGFAHMTFAIKSVTDKGFNSWVTSARHAKNQLSYAGYSSLAKPGNLAKPVYYNSVEPDLYDTILMKYMMPSSGGAKVNTAGTIQ